MTMNHQTEHREEIVVACILTRPTGSSKYGTTRKNIQRYYTPKHLLDKIYVVTSTGVTVFNQLQHDFEP